MSDLSQELFRQVIDHFDTGIIVTENHTSDWSVCYVNSTFTEMTGYTEEDVLGKNPRFLQNDDEQQAALYDLHTALNQNTSCTVTLRNYTKDGDAFWNRLTIRPLLSKEGIITHYVGSMKNLGKITSDELERARRKANHVTAFRDQQTGLFNQEYFESHFVRDWHLWLREKKDITLVMFTPDHFEIYKKTFGLAAAESALRKIAYLINTNLQRASDTVARYKENSIVALMQGDFTEDKRYFLDQIADKIHDLCVHHPHSPDEQYLTVSLTAVSAQPDHDKNPGELLNKLVTLHNSQDVNSNARQFYEYTPQ
ncbi:MAG: diguanylate cyclase [Gammaproteobacteria bacterium]|nr:diguanylate cyclase [Gammaproteobacteria bacterium]NNC97088.1 diguanylate cyclase [Gammaproteobacteria bacterium]NNM14075.1 diguanylate cyclase [Gammaproteobacteria bacterium]